MSAQEPAAIVPPMNRVERIAGRGLRDRERKERGRRRATRAEASAHEALIACLTQVHQVAFERMDWRNVVDVGPVAPAVKRDAHSAAAKRELSDYRPSMLDALLGFEAAKRRKLTDRVVDAARVDAEAYGRALEAANAHNRILKLAPDVAALKAEAIAGALRAGTIASAFRDVVEGFEVVARPGGRLIGYVDLLEFDALPDEACTLSNGGFPSHAQISLAERRQLQLANGCSVVLRAAVELLRVAPVDTVEVVARLCRSGGLSEDDAYPVLYLRLPLAALARLDLRKLEAASTVAALKARLDWNSVRGFAPIGLDDLGLAEPRLAAPA
jgi:hypothetical protein